VHLPILLVSQAAPSRKHVRDVTMLSHEAIAT